MATRARAARAPARSPRPRARPGQGLEALARHPHGIVCAVDVATLDEAARLVQAIDGVDGLVGYKIGSLLSLRLGLDATVRAFRKLTAKAVIYDHQKAGLDIPSMGAEYAEACRTAGVDGLILFPVAGPTAVDAFVGAALRAGMAAIVGGALPLPDYTVRGGGYVADDALGRIAGRAHALGARDFIVPATDLDAVRAHARQFPDPASTRLFLPGIGALGGAIKDAFGAGDGRPAHAIIGRAIYAAPSPRETAVRFAGEALAFTR